MESSLTQQEMNAVIQLIQLSGGDLQVLWQNPAKKEGVEEQETREESVGETSSSSVFNPSLEEALPRRRKRVLPIAEIYRKTKPSIKTSQI